MLLVARTPIGSMPRISPTSIAVLAVGVHPAADQLEVGVEQDAFDRGPADAAGGPLDDAHGRHCRN